MKKFIKIATVSIALASGFSFTLSNTNNLSNPVLASKLSTLKHTTKYKKTRLLKNVAIRKIYYPDPTYKKTLGRKQYVPKGSIVEIKRTKSGWYLKYPDLISETGIEPEYTVNKKMNDTSWFTFNLKNSKKKAINSKQTIGFKNDTFTAKDGGVLQINAVTRHKVHDGAKYYGTPELCVLILNGTFTNNTKWNITPATWMIKNFNVTSDGSSASTKMYNEFHSLVGTTVDEESNTEFTKPLKNLFKKVKPGKTVDFAITYDLLPGPTPTYLKLTARDNISSKHKSYTVKALPGRSYYFAVIK